MFGHNNIWYHDSIIFEIENATPWSPNTNIKNKMKMLIKGLENYEINKKGE
jgi:hypothetical protein